jgi:IS5 family transposase
MDQLGFAESFLGPEIGRNRRLERIDGLLDWPAVGRFLAGLETGDGRPPYPPLAMFKALLLQQWYGLSDPGLEEALLDRLSFRRFCGLPLDGATPDETTLCRFRGRLKDAGLGDALFGEVGRQLEAKGFC